MEEGTRKSGDLWSGVALAALGLYIIFQARQWEYLSSDGPGAGFFPLWYGLAILGLSLLLVVSHFRQRPGRGNAIDWTRLGRAFSTWFALAVVGRALQTARLRDQLRAAHLLYRRRHVSQAVENRRARRGSRARPGSTSCSIARSACPSRSASWVSDRGNHHRAPERVRGGAGARESPLVFRRRASRHGGGDPAGARAARDDRDAPAAHLQYESRGRHHYARRHLLRSEVRRVSTTSILMNVPGESASVVTCIDGYQMAKKGRAGRGAGHRRDRLVRRGHRRRAGPDAGGAAHRENGALVQLARVFRADVARARLVVLLAGRSIVKALLAALLGLWIASVGTDLFSSTSRFTFGRMELLSGIDFVVVAIGVFALAEVLANMEARDETQLLPMPKGLKNLLPTLQDLKDCRFAFVNGSVVVVFSSARCRAAARPSPRFCPMAWRRRSRRAGSNSERVS